MGADDRRDLVGEPGSLIWHSQKAVDPRIAGDLHEMGDAVDGF
ncbi:MAG: hypothetical protein V4472_16805 [Pseudomonadota bacterium]